MLVEDKTKINQYDTLNKPIRYFKYLLKNKHEKMLKM